MLKRYLVFIPATLYVNAESEEEALGFVERFECKTAGLLKMIPAFGAGVTNGFLSKSRATVEYFRDLEDGL